MFKGGFAFSLFLRQFPIFVLPNWGKEVWLFQLLSADSLIYCAKIHKYNYII